MTSRQTYDAQYAKDRAEIEDLMARYLFAFDWGDGDAYAACFTEDGEVDWARETTKGHAALKAMCLGFKEHIARIIGNVPHRHFVTQTVISVNGDEAHARAIWFEAARHADGFGKATFGHYEDTLVRINGRWLFKRRKVYNEYLPGRGAAALNPVREPGMLR